MARLATQPETVALVARALSTFMAASGMTSDATGNPENSPGPARSTANRPHPHGLRMILLFPTSGPIPTSSSHHTGTTAHNDAPMDGDNLLKCLLNHVVQLEQRVDKLERELDEKLQNGLSPFLDTLKISLEYEATERFGIPNRHPEDTAHIPDSCEQNRPPPFGRGTSQVHQCGTSGPPILVVPSLINRGDILDLSQHIALCVPSHAKVFRFLGWTGENPIVMS